MIDYKKLKNSMKQERIGSQKQREEDQLTCFYCPTAGHELCPHKTNCLLNEEISTTLNKINNLKKEQYNADPITRRKNYWEIKNLQEKLRQTKTKTGGFK